MAESEQIVDWNEESDEITWLSKNCRCLSNERIQEKFKPTKDSSKQKVRVELLCLNFLHQPGGIYSLAEKLASFPDSAIFKLRSLQVALDLIWKKMFWKMVGVYTFYCVFFVLFTYYAMFQYHGAKRNFNNPESREKLTPFMSFNLAFSFAYCVFGVWFESYQLKRQGFLKYFWSTHSIWNYFDLTTYLNVMVFCTMQFNHLEASAAYAATIEVLVFMKHFYFLRIFKKVSFFIRMVEEMIYDIRIFMLILLMVFVLISNVYFILTN